jgi:hypothetical protein
MINCLLYYLNVIWIKHHILISGLSMFAMILAMKYILMPELFKGILEYIKEFFKNHQTPQHRQFSDFWLGKSHEQIMKQMKAKFHQRYQYTLPEEEKPMGWSGYAVVGVFAGVFVYGLYHTLKGYIDYFS